MLFRSNYIESGKLIAKIIPIKSKQDKDIASLITMCNEAINKLKRDGAYQKDLAHESTSNLENTQDIEYDSKQIDNFVDSKKQFIRTLMTVKEITEELENYAISVKSPHNGKVRISEFVHGRIQGNYRQLKLCTLYDPSTGKDICDVSVNNANYLVKYIAHNGVLIREGDLVAKVIVDCIPPNFPQLKSEQSKYLCHLALYSIVKEAIFQLEVARKEEKIKARKEELKYQRERNIRLEEANRIAKESLNKGAEEEKRLREETEQRDKEERERLEKIERENKEKEDLRKKILGL